MCCDIGNIEHMNQNDDRSASDRGTNKAVWMLAWLFVNLIKSAPNLSHCRLLVPLNARRLHYLIYTLFFVVVRTGLDLGRVRTLRQQEDFSPIPRLDTVNKSLRD